MPDSEIYNLTENTVVSPSDAIPHDDDVGGTPTTKYWTGETLLAGWLTIETSKYTTTPATTSTITMSDTSDFAMGDAVRYAYGGTTYYGVITAVSTNTSITLAGATLDTGQALTELSVGGKGKVVQMPVFISGAYGDGVADLVLADMNAYIRWKLGNAWLVTFEFTHATADTGASQPKVNVKVATNAVSSNDSNNGLQLSTAGTWAVNSAIAINTTNYIVEQNDAIEIACTVAGTNGDASNLSGNLIFILE